jgi:hypothetical protein
MSDLWQGREQRVLELLADRATFGIESSDERELQQLLQTMPEFDTECMERAAAMVQLAFTPLEPLPEALRAKVHSSGLRFISPHSDE